MSWPSITDFTDAIATPRLCFSGSELEEGRPEFHPHNGRPMVYSGNFASVYPVNNRQGKYAVRCFTREVKDQQERYNQMSEYLRREKPPGFVDFEYKTRGIMVKGQWYPIVKMEWVDGDSLSSRVKEILFDSSAMRALAGRWRETAKELQQRDIAHNDLQHGNVMVRNDGFIRLVDYDGIFLPQYRGQTSPEIGHQNFQHPRRTDKDYDGYVDNFPALVIYISLLALAADPGLWKKFNNEDNLIFKKSDYQSPQNSDCFQALRRSPDADVRQLAIYLEECCSRSVDYTPDLESILNPAPAQPPQSPTPSQSYRDLLRQPVQPGQQAAKVKIDQTDFFEFCRGLNQRQLKTLTGLSFEIKQSQPDIVITLQNHQERTIRRSELRNLLADFEQNQSWHSQDYGASSGTATYCLAILRAYIDWHLLPRTMVALQTMQAELHQATADKAESEKGIQTVQAELQTLRLRSASEKSQTLKELQAVQAQLKAAVVQCPQCRMDNVGSLAYCYTCYAPLHPGGRSCSICGERVPGKGSYCPQCGRKLA